MIFRPKLRIFRAKIKVNLALLKDIKTKIKVTLALLHDIKAKIKVTLAFRILRPKLSLI